MVLPAPGGPIKIIMGIYYTFYKQLIINNLQNNNYDNWNIRKIFEDTIRI